MAFRVLQPYEPTEDSPWNVRRVVHLHRRAGFGANWSEVERDLKLGPNVAISALLEPTKNAASEEFEELSRIIHAAAVASGNLDRLRAWWLLLMLRSPDSLGERLTLMWHNHFATSAVKVQDVALMSQQNDSLRRLARGPFRDLLKEIIKGPAMLLWLDADANRKQHPNENLAREIMELFTLGVDTFRDAKVESDGATCRYTEFDIQEAARALTGWTVSANRFRVNQQTHDDGEKTVFGRTGKWDGEDLLNMLVEHRATPKRLAWRICDAFMGEECTTPELLDELAQMLASNQLHVGQAVETLLRSQAFFDQTNIGSRVLAPVEFVVGSLKSLEMNQRPPSTIQLAEWTGRMGQSLFAPPNVFGWPSGRTWLTTRTMISRSNFAGAAISGRLHTPPRPFDATTLSQRYGRVSTVEQTKLFRDLLNGGWAETGETEIFGTLEEFVAGLLASPAGQLG